MKNWSWLAEDRVCSNLSQRYIISFVNSYEHIKSSGISGNNLVSGQISGGSRRKIDSRNGKTNKLSACWKVPSSTLKESKRADENKTALVSITG